MKIKITSNPVTPYGEFSRGDILTDDKYPIAFLKHLVDEAGAAERIDYDTKVDEKVEVKKKPQSLPSSQPDKALPKKTRKRRTLKLKP